MCSPQQHVRCRSNNQNARIACCRDLILRRWARHDQLYSPDVDVLALRGRLRRGCRHGALGARACLLDLGQARACGIGGTDLNAFVEPDGDVGRNPRGFAEHGWSLEDNDHGVVDDIAQHAQTEWCLQGEFVTRNPSQRIAGFASIALASRGFDCLHLDPGVHARVSACNIVERNNMRVCQVAENGPAVRMADNERLHTTAGRKVVNWLFFCGRLRIHGRALT